MMNYDRNHPQWVPGKNIPEALRPRAREISPSPDGSGAEFRGERRSRTGCIRSSPDITEGGAMSQDLPRVFYPGVGAGACAKGCLSGAWMRRRYLKGVPMFRNTHTPLPGLTMNLSRFRPSSVRQMPFPRQNLQLYGPKEKAYIKYRVTDTYEIAL